ncbi:hypothetical protein N7540_001308 [Penicillium herquei]|nr:hypothetical protein N7540_001308 [Penicillium herquei]
MRMLIHSFIETFGMNPLPIDGGSLACLLRATWVQQALTNPCALHTTLYAASAHLDAFRGAKNSNMTLYHHTVALRLLRERINDPDAVLSESLMSCVAPLVFFSALFGDKGSSSIHKMALMKMIKAKGGLKHLALGTFLSELITVCVLTEAIIMDSTLDIPFLDIPPTPLTPPSHLVSAILRRAASKIGGYYNLSPCTIEIFKDIECVAQIWPDDPAVIDIRVKWATIVEDLLLFYPDHKLPGHNAKYIPIKSDSEAMTQACHTAGLIFWLLFLDDDDYLPPFSMAFLQFLVEKLRYAISCGSMDTWVRTAPEAHTWVCMVGTAASSKLDDRIWFSLRHGQPVTCIVSTGASVLLQSWSIYDWANQRRKQKMMVAALEDQEGFLSVERQEIDEIEGEDRR